MTTTTTAKTAHRAVDPYRTTWHRDGSLTYWDVYAQGWTRSDAAAISDSTLATMPQADRDRVARLAGR